MKTIDTALCIHCGKCTEHCLFLKKYKMDLQGFSEKPELAYHCFLCGRCKEVCPKGIDGKEVALTNRKNIVENNSGKLPDNSYQGLLFEKAPYKFANYRHAKYRAAFFTGCNLPSFYPMTTQKIVNQFAKHGIGVVYDCCGKPIEELGLEEKATELIQNINDKLKSMGVEQLIMACPNCYYFLKDRLDVEVISVYEKMTELGIGMEFEKSRVPIYYPCPDRKDKKFSEDISFFIKGQIVDAFSDIQCCGLGGCAAGKEPELVQRMTKQAEDSGEAELYTYCASCISNFRRKGYGEAKHLLPILMGVDEKVPLGMTPLVNRMKCKFK